jgi:Fic family protein
MKSFVDLSRHFASFPPERVQLLTRIAESKGREEAFRGQNPVGLETLRQVALIQSTESSNAIENVRAPRARIEALVADKTTPQNRPEEEIAGYRHVLDQIHANAVRIPFEPRYVEQLHGYLYRFTGDRTAGRWKRLDNKVEERYPDGRVVERFIPVSADATPQAIAELHMRFAEARATGAYPFLLLVAAYVLDFLVIHPFRDGNGRMARLITLWLLYLGGYEVGRYISLEKLIEESRETYYEALHRSTQGWHEDEHDLEPWTDYFLGIVAAAYADLESRATLLAGRGSKKALVKTFIRSSLSEEFSVAEIREAAPGVSDAHISKVLAELKRDGAVEPLARGRNARWRRLRAEFD